MTEPIRKVLPRWHQRPTCTPPLTEREGQVLLGLCESKLNKEIARDLDIEEATVKLHVKTLFEKLDARNRVHAALIAIANGWIVI